MRLVRLAVISTLLLAATPSAVHAEVLDGDAIGRTTVGAADAGIAAMAPDAGVPAGILTTFDGTVLWARDPDAARPMASTTKIMSCLLALEAVDPDERVTVSARAAAIGGSGVYLRSGETLTAGELLTAMMLESSNSAATALAEHVAGSESAFVDSMNARARELDLGQTSYRNPHGLDADGHHTSARDLATLAVQAMRVQAFRELVAHEQASIPGPSGERKLENSNQLIGRYDGATGVKTGWTTPAGYCLVASAARADVALMCVVLGADHEDARFVEAERLLDWGFAHYGPTSLTSVEQTVAAVTVSDYLDRCVVARVGADTQAFVLDLDGEIRREYEVVTTVEAPVEQGQELGILRVFQGDVPLAEVPLVADESIPKPDLWERVRVFFTRLWQSWFGNTQGAAVPTGA